MIGPPKARPVAANRSNSRVGAAAALCFGALLLTFVVRTLLRTSRDHADWTQKDEALDRDLEASFDASDPIGRY